MMDPIHITIDEEYITETITAARGEALFVHVTAQAFRLACEEVGIYDELRLEHCSEISKKFASEDRFRVYVTFAGRPSLDAVYFVSWHNAGTGSDRTSLGKDLNQQFPILIRRRDAVLATRAKYK